MNNTKFTPGPWRVVEYQQDGEDLYPASIFNDLGVVADIHAREGNLDDARLIAAAPDLYAAIEAFLSYLEHDDSLHTAEAGQINEQMRAALAKARGEK